MRSSRLKTLVALLLSVLMLLGTVNAQSADQEWEYLVVSYGTTYFNHPVLDIDAANAVFSKVQLFSEIGVTIPQEAIGLQRNIDVLGKFGWEMVTIVGAIGGDQQIVFKRPYDAEQSAAEAERIKAEREELIAAYNTVRETAATPGDDEEVTAMPLVDLDAVERAQATEERNQRDAQTVRDMINQVAARGYTFLEINIEGEAYLPDSDPIVTVELIQDVTATALVAPGQYRSSLARNAMNEVFAVLEELGTVQEDFCFGRTGPGEINIRVTAVVQHEGEPAEVARTRKRHCYTP